MDIPPSINSRLGRVLMLRARPPRLDRRRQGSADWLIERLFHAVVGVIEPPLQKVSALHDGEVHRLTVKPRVVRKLVVGSALFLEVVAHLRRGLSPEQIAFTLGSMDEPVRLSHETIYTALYAMQRGQLRARILTLLRCARQHRRLRSAGKDRGKSIPNMTLIDDRPIEVEERLVPGHWEGDLIKGKRGQSQVGTLVERTTLYVARVKLENGKADTATGSHLVTVLCDVK